MQENAPHDPKDTREIREATTTRGLLGEIVRFAIIVLPIVFFIRVFIAQPFIVSGGSMDPTFATGQYLIIDELSYRFSTPERGEVIVFRYPKDPSRFYIKRIIGLPDEIVTINNGAVAISTKANPIGFALDENYIQFSKDESSVKKLGPNEYFVMGDNRAASSDSRSWGPVNQDMIIGRVLLRLLPIANAGINPGNIDYQL